MLNTNTEQSTIYKTAKTDTYTKMVNSKIQDAYACFSNIIDGTKTFLEINDRHLVDEILNDIDKSIDKFKKNVHPKIKQSIQNNISSLLEKDREVREFYKTCIIYNIFITKGYNPDGTETYMVHIKKFSSDFNPLDVSKFRRQTENNQPLCRDIYNYHKYLCAVKK